MNAFNSLPGLTRVEIVADHAKGHQQKAKNATKTGKASTPKTLPRCKKLPRSKCRWEAESCFTLLGTFVGDDCGEEDNCPRCIFDGDKQQPTVPKPVSLALNSLKRNAQKPLRQVSIELDRPSNSADMSFSDILGNLRLDDVDDELESESQHCWDPIQCMDEGTYNQWLQ